MRSDFLETILKEKKKEVATLTYEEPKVLRKTYSFVDYVKSHGDRMQLIAEVKKASPSLGDINTSVDIIQQAKLYEENKAAMISVLTDQVFFKGDISYLKRISDQVAIPTLAKDFIIDEKQIIRSLNAGATVILLIVAALSFERLRELYDYARSLGLEVLVETHNQEELKLAHRLGADLIGINNRNLQTFMTDLQVSVDLSNEFKSDRVYISESAISSQEDVRRIAPYFNGILVGTALMTSPNITQKIKELRIDKG